MTQNIEKTVHLKNTTKTGDFGEKIAVKFLKNKGFFVLETNYRRPCGELDIVAKNKGIVSFVEVKTVSHETKHDLEHSLQHNAWRPEELVRQFKLHQIAKTLQVWIAENQYGGEWNIDVVAIHMAPREKYAVVDHIENIIIE